MIYRVIIVEYVIDFLLVNSKNTKDTFLLEKKKEREKEYNVILQFLSDYIIFLFLLIKIDELNNWEEGRKRKLSSCFCDQKQITKRVRLIFIRGATLQRNEKKKKGCKIFFSFSPFRTRFPPAEERNSRFHLITPPHVCFCQPPVTEWKLFFLSLSFEKTSSAKNLPRDFPPQSRERIAETKRRKRHYFSMDPSLCNLKKKKKKSARAFDRKDFRANR